MKAHKIQQIKANLEALIDGIQTREKENMSVLDHVSDAYRKSARNLIHYKSLRSYDIRKLQRKLGYLGMTRLARAEAHVEVSLRTTLFYLKKLLNEPAEFPVKNAISIKGSEKLLLKHTTGLLGQKPKSRRLSIMVTMPSKSAHDYGMVEDMLSRGMNCARINCAHDNQKVWSEVIANIRLASDKLQKKVTITMDLGGPKIRTGELAYGPKIKVFQPMRNEYGQVVHPAVIRLVSPGKTHLGDNDLPVATDWSKRLTEGQEIKFADTRGKKRRAVVTEILAHSIITECQDSAYIETGTQLEASHGATEVGELPPIDQSIFLRKGDILHLYRMPLKGSPATYNKNGEILIPGFISTTLPEVLDYVHVGESVFFDDGKIQGEINEKHKDYIAIRITRVKSGGAKLRADKGLNFPRSSLKIRGLTEKDKEDLKFIAMHADAVNFSFVNTPRDVSDILNELEKLGVKDKLGVILKIETQQGYNNLTDILLEGMKSSKLGVMIARGDLAIEVGWDRIGDVQREILAICNACHVPVVWATQVLENLAKKGLPARSEITDAVNATKAECVMLNKGPHIVQAIELLNQIIVRSEEYQDKNAPMLPKLRKLSG